MYVRGGDIDVADGLRTLHVGVVAPVHLLHHTDHLLRLDDIGGAKIFHHALVTIVIVPVFVIIFPFLLVCVGKRKLSCLVV